MGFAWRPLRIDDFKGLDLKSNIMRTADGRSLNLENCYQAGDQIAHKRPGFEPLFETDEADPVTIDEVVSCTLLGTKYWVKFADGDLKYSTARNGAVTTISPTPAIATGGKIWTVVLDNKLFFVDGTNALRYFDGAAVLASAIYIRPTVALTTATVGTGFDFVYTIDNGLGESPAVTTALVDKASTATVRVQGNTGPQTLVAGDTVRVYSRATTVAATSKLVATYVWQAADVVAGFKDVTTVAISDDQAQLYTELGLAVNKTAVTALEGIGEHCGRLVGWKGDFVYNSKVTNPHSWPDDSAAKEAFVYGFNRGDGDAIEACVSFRESLYVLKPKAVAIFGGIGPDDTGNNAYSFRRLEVKSKGCVAGKTARVIGQEEDTYLIYLSLQGFMATDGSDPVEIGEDIETSIQGASFGTLNGSISAYDTRLGLYVAFIGLVAARTTWVLDVRKDKDAFTGWWKWTGLNASCCFWDEDRLLLGLQNGLCGSQRVAGISTDFRDVELSIGINSGVDDTTDIVPDVGYATGTEVMVRRKSAAGDLPEPLSVGVTYFVINVSDNEVKLAATLADALAGTAIDLTTPGTASFSLLRSIAIDAFYTTNWINFGTFSAVKKLGKPCIVFNAVAQSINLMVSWAYDWVEPFQDEVTIAQASSDEWGTQPWGQFVWGQGADSTPKNDGTLRRKVRSIRAKFRNATIDEDFNLQGMEIPYAPIRNRGNYAA